ncbi:B-box zinc finger protein 21 isoform X2 [Elaeis guineensis]|uniref:B-box zinc finger protein 21 isoform X2 n=1 Tax=Elaeis guineensis var. tenera TaxID=51953 RepID=A0A6I9QB34_ELAGV|nr:B-box zinc finger protein 21 isoform X2 [Elaeis guineensis]
MCAERRRRRCSAAPTRRRSASPATAGSTAPTSSPASTAASPSCPPPPPPPLPLRTPSATSARSSFWGRWDLQERRGFVFCQEDRAILCRDCDVPIHGANHLTMKHNRFLLTGLRLSSAPISSSSSSSSPEAEIVVAGNNNSDHSNKSVLEKSREEALLADDSVLCSSDSSINTSTFAAAAANQAGSNSGAGGGSSISDYLIKMCPGWRVEDLLVDDAAASSFAADGFSKMTMDEMLPFMEADLEGAGLEAVAEEFPIWVPHVPQIPPPELPAVPPGGGAATAGVHYQPWVAAKDLNSTHLLHGAKAADRERWSDDAFTVPQIAPASSNPGKRPRQQQSLWYY